MVINLPYLLIAVVLVWFPRAWMRFGAVIGRRRRRRGGADWKKDPWNRRDATDPRLNFRFEFTKGRNYFDLIRAAAGSLVIMGGFGIQPCLVAAEGSSRLIRQEVLALQLAILTVALLLQTLRFEHHRLSFFAPVFFVAGLSVALCGPWAALFAFVLVWGVNSMFENAQGFLSIYALLLAGFGLLFRSANYRLVIAAAVLCFLPVLLSLLTRRRLGVFTRKGAHVRMV